MKTIITPGGQLGKFTVYQTLSDRYICDGVEYPFSALGNSHVIGDWIEPPIDLVPIKAEAIQAIDVDVDKIYADVIGNRGTEYSEAEREALDFKAAGYTGPVPPTVQSWATVKNWTPQAAADDIITQATSWRNAALSIRANRLKEKEAIRVAASMDEINAAQARWTGYRTAIRTALGINV